MQNKIKKTKILISKKTIKSKKYDDFYFNSIDGLSESRYVYLNSNNLINRFKNHDELVISELGFGIGLNFLITLEAYLKVRKKNSKLHFISFEKNPLKKKHFEKFYYKNNFLIKYSRDLITKLPIRLTGIHDIYFKKYNVFLTLIYNNFDYLEKFNYLSDAWYIDGFSPKKNKSAWKQKIINSVFYKTKNNGTFSSFTSSSSVQKKFKTAGFELSKKKGFAFKREMIFGCKKSNFNEKITSIYPKKENIKIAIVGSGITGCSLAYSLKIRGIKCIILEKNNKLGSGASGNPLALQIPNITLDNNILGLLSLRSYIYSRNLAISLNAAPQSKGVIVFPTRDRDKIKFEKLLKMGWKKLFKEYKGVFKSSNTCCHLFPEAGVVDTSKFLNNLKDGVKVYFNTTVTDIIDYKNKILINTRFSKKFEVDYIIWANGHEMYKNLDEKIIIPTAGQVSFLRSNQLTKNLKLNFSFGKFFSQSYNNYHQIGATFSRENFEINNENDVTNFSSIPINIIKKFNFKINDIFDSRMSIRASTKNRLPLLKKNKKELFLGGMGSWGFNYAPFLAEILVRKLFDEPIILEQNILKNIES